MPRPFVTHCLNALTRLSLRGRLLWVLAIVWSGLLAVMTSLILGNVISAARTSLVRDGEHELKTLALVFSEPAVLRDYPTIEQLLRNRMAQGDLRLLRYRYGDITLSAQAIPNGVARPDWFARLIDLAPPMQRQEVRVGSVNYGLIELEDSPGLLEDRIWNVMIGSAFAMLVGVLLLLGLMNRVLQANLLGLTAIRKSSTRFLQGDYTARVELPEDAPPELLETAHVLNEMRVKLGSMVTALATSEERFRNLATTATDAIILATDDDRILFWNNGAKNLFGYGQADILGQSITILIPERFRKAHDAGIARIREGEAGRYSGHSIEVAGLCRDGTEVPVEISLNSWKNENTRYFVAIVRDITGRNKIEAELRQARDAAEAANLAKSQFLATMSHEIRTPMNGVLGMAQLLLDGDIGKEERIDYARTIYNSGQTLLAILNDILDLSKVEAGKIEIEHIAFSPEQLLHEVMALFEELAHGKGLELETVWQGEAKQRYRGDPTRLRQILSNLVSNAIKFSDGGYVQIVAEELGVSGNEVLLCFTVADRGQGISPELRHRLFQPFSQLDATVTRRFGGTGLGLAIAQGLVRLMGGDIGVESTEGKGSTFWFTVRVELAGRDEESRVESRTPSHFGHTAESPAATGHRILVVEDTATNRQVIRAILNKLGYASDAVTHGREAIEAVTTGGNPYDLVLMDCQMPEMDGFEATRRIRAWEQENARSPLPIVALTAGAFQEDRNHCIAAGMDDFLTKPVHIGDLAAALDNWLGKGGA